VADDDATLQLEQAESAPVQQVPLLRLLLPLFLVDVMKPRACEWRLAVRVALHGANRNHRPIPGAERQW
jgi:hypothetical protein